MRCYNFNRLILPRFNFNDIVIFVKIFPMKFLQYLFILLLVPPAFSQSKVTLTDKEYQKLHDKARGFLNSDIDSSFFYANKIEQSNNYLHQSFAVGLKSYLFQIKGDSVTSKKLYKQAFELLEKTPRGIERSKVNSYLLNYGGLAEWKKGNYSKALKYYQQGKAVSKSINDLMQMVKFNNNISVIHKEVGNYEYAIRAAKESDRLTDEFEYLYDEEQFDDSKAKINFNLGGFYESYYFFKPEKVTSLDSAEYYYKKAILFSKKLNFLRVSSEIGLSNIYFLQRDFEQAKKGYHKLLIDAKNDSKSPFFSGLNRNLGQVYFNIKEYDNALIYFKQVDSVYNQSKNNFDDYILSNYFQAKIYGFKKDYDKALLHSEIYLKNFEKSEKKLNKETLDINYNLSKQNLEKEMNELEESSRLKVLLKNVGYAFLVILFFVLIFSLVKNRKDKKETDRKLNLLIAQYKEEIEKKNVMVEALPKVEPAVSMPESTAKRESNVISIDEEKENEIVEKLKALEAKQMYLNPDFTQQFAAKKIKTNTTYLSYVVNKRFGKSFSEYSNELKINYVINEMITNPTYRKYSTQAIAESAGFKNAVSFTKSFSKRTGVTPVQFAKKLDTTNL